jgi:hypothetical protein
MKFFPAFLLILIVAISCKNKAGQPAAGSKGSDSTAAADSNLNYMPVADLIRADLKYVDSFAGGILKRTTINDKKDSSYIKPAQLHLEAQAFLIPELEPEAFRKSFKETSLMDETTQLLQFIYTPVDATSSLRNVVVYVDPASTNNDVSRVYLEREWASGDTLIRQKLTWKMKQFFYIITTREPKQGNSITSIEKLIWDPMQFED